MWGRVRNRNPSPESGPAPEVPFINTEDDLVSGRASVGTLRSKDSKPLSFQVRLSSCHVYRLIREVFTLTGNGNYNNNEYYPTRKHLPNVVNKLGLLVKPFSFLIGMGGE